MYFYRHGARKRPAKLPVTKRLEEERKMMIREEKNCRQKSRLVLRLLFGLAAVCGVDVGALASAADAPVVRTQDGPVTGLDCTGASGPCSGSGVEQFRGIPYAAPPVGTLRWTPPQPHERWPGVFKATTFGSPCTQLDKSRHPIGSEDCLYLNIFRPSQQNDESQGDHEDHGERLPVMVWIHGGVFVSGRGDEYNATQLVKRGAVIVVTINYRLGHLGFFAHPALDAEGHLNANYGLMDQQYALKWVQRNIAAFGGDPKRVTIFGQSAGGISVYANLASPTAAGLFQRAIAESGSTTLFQRYFDLIDTLAKAENNGTNAAASVGCGNQGNQTAQCLRATPASVLVAKQPLLLMPIVDGTVLTQTLDLAFESGQFNRVPVISGSNHDEYRYNVALTYDWAGNPLKDDGYVAAVAAFMHVPENNKLIPVLVSQYPLSNYHAPVGTQRAPLALGALGTDFYFACTARNAVRLLSEYVPTFAYEFNDENAPWGYDPISFPSGAAHGSELAYLFPPSNRPGFRFTPAQQRLSEAMISYWTEFAHSGNPNSEKTPHWSSYDARSDKFQSMIPPAPTVESNFDTDHQCSSLWNTL
jgi:para-nitrobenzyl esterase